MNRKWIHRTVTLVAATALIGLLSTSLFSPARAQQEQGKQPRQMHGKMMEKEATAGEKMDCRAMMERMEKMQSMQEKMQRDLSALVERMNAAAGEEQQELMAQALTTMVQQRGEMQTMMQKMRPMMMQHMMQHMQAAQSGGMEDCPLMESMGAGKSQDGGKGHAEHH